MIELNQSPVRFVSEGHKYYLGDKELAGITSTLIKRAFPDTYKKPERYTEEEWQAILNNAAEKGSNMHETIELYDELGMTSELPELQSYIRIKEENHLSVLATEYVVSDEEHYATAIDKVMMTQDGGIILVDFKRTYALHIDNVTLQQSICKRWFEKLNPGLKVSGIYVMWLRDNKSRFEKLTPWPDEALDELIRSDMEGSVFDITKNYGDLPAMVAAVEEEVARLEMVAKQAKEQQEKLRDGLYKVMTQYGKKSYKGEKIQLTVIEPTTKKSFDSKRFKEENEELYEKYTKETKQEGYLKIKVL